MTANIKRLLPRRRFKYRLGVRGSLVVEFLAQGWWSHAIPRNSDAGLHCKFTVYSPWLQGEFFLASLGLGCQR
jgi:hypothetical protein